jgi:hypothetical protein
MRGEVLALLHDFDCCYALEHSIQCWIVGGFRWWVCIIPRIHFWHHDVGLLDFGKQTSESILTVQAPRYLHLFHIFNIRAFVAFICGIAPNLAGLAKATGNKDVPKAATYIYSLSWLVGMAVAFGIDTVAGKILAYGGEV